MADDFIPEFLGGEPLPPVPAEAAPAVEAPQAPAEAAPAAEAPAAEPTGQARGPDGKFAAAEAQPAPEAASAAEAPAAEAPAAQPAPHVDPMAPVAALMDEREKRQKAEQERDAANARARELEQWRQQQEAAGREQAIPDPAQDPAGHEAWRQGQERARVEAVAYSQKLSASRLEAKIDHGADVFNAAHKWGFERCETDPFFNEKVRASDDPYNLIVAEWRQAQALEKFGAADPKDYEAFLAWKATQPGGQASAAAAPATPAPSAAAPAAAPAAPRPSLASAPSAGTAAEPRVGDFADVFDGTFTRK